MSDNKQIKVGITHGDTNGIGYEVILGALEDFRINEICTPIVYGSKKLSSYHKKVLNFNNVQFNYINHPDESKKNKPNLIDVCDESIEVEFGVATPDSGKAAFQSLERAVEDLKNGAIDVLVTAPIHKDGIQDAGFNFPGHTEYLADKFQGKSLMFMVSERVRVAVVTGHIPVSEVSNNLKPELIEEKLKTMHESLINDFNIRKPRIAVLGLNPHAGDNGLLGKEDKEIIAPVIEKMKAEKIMAFGPFSADGFFGNGSHHNFDAVLAMYHDQGLIPFKTLSFGEGVNFTAGLSAIRTSPDHGTGFDIAGKRIADHSSILRAIFTATEIYKSRHMNLELVENQIEPNLWKKVDRNKKNKD
jgi:4-hydroxythreonine-4-phosphate dehydrogenase